MEAFYFFFIFSIVITFQLCLHWEFYIYFKDSFTGFVDSFSPFFLDSILTFSTGSSITIELKVSKKKKKKMKPHLVILVCWNRFSLLNWKFVSLQVLCHKVIWLRRVKSFAILWYVLVCEMYTTWPKQIKPWQYPLWLVLICQHR